MRFDSYHPTINLIYFIAVITASVLFRHPVFLGISFAASFAYSVKLNGKRTFIFNMGLIPCIGVWTWWYSYYHHFGVTNLHANIIGNQVTLEAVVSGLVIGVAGASLIQWASCMHTIFHTDKIVYLFGRISPKLSLFLSLLLRTVPRLKYQTRKIKTARSCMGKGGGAEPFYKKIQNAFRIFSALITWISESFIITSDSMRSRGYTLKGRTAFSIYRFDLRDRSLVITMFFCLAILTGGFLLDQTSILYNPRIIMNRITPLSGVFYLAYAFFCMLPMGLQIAGEMKYQGLKKQNHRDFSVFIKQ